MRGLGIGVFALLVGCSVASEPLNETSSKASQVSTLATIGDSITQAANVDDAQPLDLAVMFTNPAAIFHDNVDQSWAQGTDPRISSVRSHYTSLNPNLVMTPYSRSGAELVGRGATTPNFEKQARSIATAGGTPDMLYVLLGGNDVCNRPPSETADAAANMYSVEEWREAAVRGLTALAEVMPAGATVRVVSVPRVDALYTQVGPAAMTVLYDGSLVKDVNTCGAWWSLAAQYGHGICPIVTAEASAERRAMVGARIDAYNDALAAEVRRFGRDAALNPKRIAFQSDWHGSIGSGAGQNTSGGTFIFEGDHVSKLDCFHPSIAGQKALADLVLHRATFD